VAAEGEECSTREPIFPLRNLQLPRIMQSPAPKLDHCVGSPRDAIHELPGTVPPEPDRQRAPGLPNYQPSHPGEHSHQTRPDLPPPTGPPSLQQLHGNFPGLSAPASVQTPPLELTHPKLQWISQPEPPAPPPQVLQPLSGGGQPGQEQAVRAKCWRGCWGCPFRVCGQRMNSLSGGSLVCRPGFPTRCCRANCSRKEYRPLRRRWTQGCQKPARPCG